MNNRKTINIPFSDKSISDYERLLLGCYVLGAAIGEGIGEAVFMSGAHRAIFPALRELKARLPSLDIMIVIAELTKRGLLDKAGGAAYVATLTDGAITANAEFYAGEVLAAFRGRATWRAAALAKEALERGEAPDDVRAALAANIEAVSARVAGGADSGISFSDLLKKQFPPDSWYIEGLIGSGLTVLTGASKIGKSWIALQLVTALDQGGCFMGTLRAQKCDVLYLALEDTPRRIQRRILKQGMAPVFNGSRLETGRRTVPDLRAYLKANPQFRVVIIDTLQKMLGMNDLNDYSQTVAGLSALKAIADDLDRAVIVIHHNRKGGNEDGDHMESALGSTGINATADCTLTMRRRRGIFEATLSATGRDVEDASYTLAWDRDICTWAVTGQGALKASLTEAQQQIVDLLESEGRNWTVGEIAKSLNKGKSTVSEQAKKIHDMGLIDCPFQGQYRAKSPFGRSASLRETETPKLEDGPSPGEEAARGAQSPGRREAIAGAEAVPF